MIGTITTANAAEFQNNIGEYLNMVANGEEVVVTRDGEMLGRFVPKNRVMTHLTDTLTGILKNHRDNEQTREMSDNDEDTATAAIEAMINMSRMAEEAGIADMTLDEINAEIEAVRRGQVEA